VGCSSVASTEALTSAPVCGLFVPFVPSPAQAKPYLLLLTHYLFPLFLFNCSSSFPLFFFFFFFFFFFYSRWRALSGPVKAPSNYCTVIWARTCSRSLVRSPRHHYWPWPPRLLDIFLVPIHGEEKTWLVGWVWEKGGEGGGGRVVMCQQMMSGGHAGLGSSHPLLHSSQPSGLQIVELLLPV